MNSMRAWAEHEYNTLKQHNESEQTIGEDALTTLDDVVNRRLYSGGPYVTIAYASPRVVAAMAKAMKLRCSFVGKALQVQTAVGEVLVHSLPAMPADAIYVA